MADDPNRNAPRGLLRLTQRDTDWFRPLWRRVAVVAFVGGWLGWEFFYTHDETWTLIVMGLLAYAVWVFFIRYKPAAPKQDGTPPDPGKGRG